MQTPELKNTFRGGAKTFSLAALFFRAETYWAACQIYSWCRYCDDQVDSSADQGEQALGSVVDSLRQKTLSVFRREPQSELPFAALQTVVMRYDIPETYALDLIEGMAMDARQEEYESLDRLEVYAYRVAGTVGLMMTYVLGVSDPQARFHAKQLGIAMQLTNISRDIVEDAEMGRIYLPLRWLREEGLDRPDILRPESRPKLALLAHRLVQTAETYYQDGNRGLRYLKFRNALAIAIASSIYRAIGHYVVRRGSKAWDTRTVVPFSRKLWEILLSPIRARSFS